MEQEMESTLHANIPQDGEENWSVTAKLLHDNPDADQWIVQVSMRHTTLESSKKQEYTVYVTADDLRVHPAGVHTERDKFQWTDWIFDNSGDVVSAAVIAALAVDREP